jgi:hypothetical protein
MAQGQPAVHGVARNAEPAAQVVDAARLLASVAAELTAGVVKRAKQAQGVYALGASERSTMHILNQRHDNGLLVVCIEDGRGDVVETGPTRGLEASVAKDQVEPAGLWF